METRAKPPPTTTAQKLIGYNAGSNREKNDFYATTPNAAQSLFDVEKFHGALWEPACGDGAICKIAEQNGYEVTASDLVDRGYGDTGHDFLMQWQPRAPNIVTNPPFKLATPFVLHALHMVRKFPGDPIGRKVAMLLKIPYLEGVERAEVFDNAGFARLYVFRRRVSFLRGGTEAVTMNGKGGMIAYGWFVWEIGYTAAPTIHWLEGEPCK